MQGGPDPNQTPEERKAETTAAKAAKKAAVHERRKEQGVRSLCCRLRCTETLPQEFRFYRQCTRESFPRPCFARSTCCMAGLAPCRCAALWQHGIRRHGSCAHNASAVQSAANDAQKKAGSGVLVTEKTGIDDVPDEAPGKK